MNGGSAGAGAPTRGRWRRAGRLALAIPISLAVMLALCQPALAAGAGTSSHEASEAVRWGLLIGLGAEGAVTLLFFVFGAKVRALVVGLDNRASTSKTIAAMWTFVVGVALLGIVYAKLIGHAEPLEATERSGVIGQYAALFGGPLGAAIVAKGIVNSQTSGAEAKPKPSAAKASASDLVSNDAGEVDLGDFQYVVFNLVALAFVLGTLLVEPANGLPHIPDVLLGLTSVSAVGYVGKKALTSQSMLAITLEPREGPQGAEVTYTITGPALPQPYMWVRFGEDHPGELIGPGPGGAGYKRPVPNVGVGAGTTVAVKVILSDGTVVSAGTYKYT